ncbi:hypothetical protein AYO21_02640 [Fonsecaea monophora]|uniref:Hydrophobin n=1 Tax=Fonsecaea monophora TaxID=254056 RepID=A0A177FH23_9EURO|nr:hypothetical protein AYO21_02640 [Fonsecaea monophora]OAG43021.1 hypothetical protein AYO21_02640 [Fonsecaea monophora]
MRFTTLAIALAAGATTALASAIPGKSALVDRQVTLCTGADSSAVCCATDVLGVADLDCAPPDPEDTNVSDLEDPVLEIGSPIHHFLVRKGRNPSIAGGSCGNLLNCAVATASVSILEDIMAVCDGKELSVKNADVEGKLASHFAATGANQRAFELALLPDLGAKDKQGGRSFVDDKTAEGYTAEDIAILHQKTHFIPYLRSNNDDVSVADVDEDELSRLAKKVREVSAGACVSYFCTFIFVANAIGTSKTSTILPTRSSGREVLAH